MQTDVKISQQLIQGVVFKLCYRKVYRTDFISCIQRVKFVSQPATTRTVCRVGDMDHLIRNDPDSTLLRENKSLGCNIQILSFFLPDLPWDKNTCTSVKNWTFLIILHIKFDFQFFVAESLFYGGLLFFENNLYFLQDK